MIWRLLYRLYRLVSWIRHWSVRRLAPPGWAVLAGVLATGMVAGNTENSVAYQGLAMLFFLLMTSTAFCVVFRLRFSARRHLPRFGTAGQPFSYGVTLKNLTRNPQCGLELIEDLADPRPSLSEWREVQLADEHAGRSFRVSRRHANPFRAVTVKASPVAVMPPGGEVDVRVELTPLRRGVLRFRGVTLARPDPFGLLRALSRCRVPESVAILPRRYPVPSIPLPGSLKYQQGGVALASNVGQSDEFVALRDYRRGDPLRHIHWRSWARTGKPIVKEFQDEFFVRHALVLDTFIQEPQSEIFEETQESLLDLLFVGSETFCFTAGRGLAHADQMLEILASVRECRDKPFQTLEQRVLGHLGLVSGCICVLLAWDRERREFIQKIRTLGVPVTEMVIVRAEQGGTLDPGPLAGDPRQFHVLEAGRIKEGLARL